MGEEKYQLQYRLSLHFGTRCRASRNKINYSSNNIIRINQILTQEEAKVVPLQTMERTLPQIWASMPRCNTKGVAPHQISRVATKCNNSNISHTSPSQSSPLKSSSLVQPQ